MKVSRLIKQLQEAKAEHGDLEVTFAAESVSDYDGSDECDVAGVLCIDGERLLLVDGLTLEAAADFES